MGRANFVDLGEMLQMMREVGAAQDKIGWGYWAEGEIARLIRNLQEYYLLSCPTHLTIDTWMRGLI